MLDPSFSCIQLITTKRSFNQNAENQSQNLAFHHITEDCTLASESVDESMHIISTVTQYSHSYLSYIPISLCSYHSKHHITNNAHQVDSFTMRCTQNDLTKIMIIVQPQRRKVY